LKIIFLKKPNKIVAEDVFSLNEAYHSAAKKVKVNSIQKKETVHLLIFYFNNFSNNKKLNFLIERRNIINNLTSVIRTIIFN